MTYDIHQVYMRYRQLTGKQRRHLLADLQAQGINTTGIEAYEYPEAPGIKHMFFYFPDSREAIPYFELEPETWEQIQRAIMLTEYPLR